MDASDARVERLRRVNRYKAMQAELAQQREEAAFEANRQRKAEAAARDEALAKELCEQQRLELKDEKMLQLVRAFPMLRELESLLKDAHTKRGRADQLKEVYAERERRVQEERDYIEKLKEQTRVAAAREEERRIAEFAAFKRHQNAQLELIEERKARAAQEAEERRKERVAVDAVVARVQEKDFLDALERREQQRLQQEEADEFYRQRAEIKAAARLRDQREEMAIQAYHAEQGRRRETDKKLMLEREAIKARILGEQSRRISEERRRRDELESLLHDYYEAERIARERKSMRDDVDRRERLAAEARDANLQLIEDRREKDALVAQEEARLRELAVKELALSAKRAKDEKLRNAEMKRQQQAESQRFLDERKRLKDEERRQEGIVDERNRLYRDELNDYVKRARAMMLAEYMPNLGEFAPAHALTQEEKKLYGIIK